MLQSILTVAIESVCVTFFVLFFIAFLTTMSKKSKKSNQEITFPESQELIPIDNPQELAEKLKELDMPKYPVRTANQSMSLPSSSLVVSDESDEFDESELNELKLLAKELKIKGWNFYKDPEKLRRAIDNRTR